MDLLTAMRIYVRVVERGSISVAARDLAMAQPTVSERIDRLEKHLGIHLLRRSPRSMTCTSEGALFYEKSRRIVAMVDDTYASISLSTDVVKGNIRIAAPQCFGDAVAPFFIKTLREEHPELRVDLVLNDRITDPVTEGVDVSIRLGANVDGNIIAFPLGYIRQVLVASPAYLAAERGIHHPDDLASHPFIHVKGTFSNARLPLLDAQGAKVEAPISSSVTTSRGGPMAALILAGCGIGVIQEPAGAEALSSGRLVRLLPEFSVPRFEINAIVPHVRPIPGKVRATIEKIKDLLPSVRGYDPLPAKN